MNIRDLNSAIAWLETHPADFAKSSYELETAQPDIPFATWLKAKTLAEKPEANPLHKVDEAGDTTIVHIDVANHSANVTYNGISRTFKLKAIDPLQLIEAYKNRGYRYTWMGNVALLTKKIHGNRKAKVAA